MTTPWFFLTLQQLITNKNWLSYVFTALRLRYSTTSLLYDFATLQLRYSFSLEQGAIALHLEGVDP